MSNIIGRRFEYADVSQINHLFFQVFGRHRTEEQFSWEFLEIPGGPAEIWVLEDKSNSEIIGHYSLIPIQFSYFGELIQSGKTENTMIHPEYRKKGIYIPFEMDCINQAKSDFQLIWVSYSSVIKTHKKAGYKPVGILTHYIKVLKKDRLVKILSAATEPTRSNRIIVFLARFAARLLTQILLLKGVQRSIFDDKVYLKKMGDTDSISHDLEKLWKSAKRNYGITIDRHIHFLRWRIVNNPYINYDFFGVLKHNNLIGYVVLRKNEVRGINMSTVVDLILDCKDQSVLDAVLHKVTNIYKGTDVDLINFPTLLSNNYINRSLRKNGFISIAKFRRFIDGKKPLLMANLLSDRLDLVKVFDCNSWYFTEIFTQGIQ